MAGKFNKQELNNKGNQVKLRGFFYQNLYQSWLEQWEYNINRAGIKDTDICPLCNSECQSLIHMLFSYMSASSTFWNQFRLWWQETFQEEITLSGSVILYDLTTSSLSPNGTFSLQVYAMAT